MDASAFQPFGPSHLFAIAATLGIGFMMVSLQRSRTVPETWKRGSAWTLAVLLVMAVMADPMLAWIRYSATDPIMAARMVHENSWPLHFCDIAAFLCAIALVWKNQRTAELAYLWGVAGTAQGLITPALNFEWWSAEYWAFFIQHGGVPVAGITLAFGMGLAPQPGAVRRAISWGVVFLLVAALGNWIIGLCCPGTCPNYGFVRAKPNIGSLFDYLGPWPWYLLTMVVISTVFFNLLCLPWRFKAKNLRSMQGPDNFPT